MLTRKAKNKQMKAKVMNPFSWTADGVLAISEWASVFAALLAFAFSLAAVWSGRIVDNRTDLKLLALEKSNIASQRALEAERLTRVELEESIAPRSIAFTNKSLPRLKRFKDTPIVIQFVPDAEAQRLAGQIAFPLQLAGWRVLGIERSFEGGIPDGITLDTRLPEKASAEEKMKARGAAPVPAARELTEFLEANGLMAATASWEKAWGIQKIPLGAIRIWVGFKPTPYFDEKLLAANETEGLTRLLTQHKAEDKERKEQLRKDWFLPSRAPQDSSKFMPEQRSEPRHISDTQRSKALAFIKEFSSGLTKFPAEIRCPANNQEACAFADEVVALLRAGDWPITGDAAIRDTDFPLTLRGVVVKEPADPRTAATRGSSIVLFDALRGAAIEIELSRSFDSSKIGVVPIFVGW